VYTGVVYAGRGRVQPSKRRRSPLAPVGQRGTTSLPTPPEQWILVGHIPALVTRERFEHVQAKLKTNQQFARRNNRAHTYLLRALVSCGCCGLSCAGQTRKRYSYYACVGKSHPSRSGREQKCGNRLIPMRQLDEVVWADLCDLLMHPEAIQQAVQRAQNGEWFPQEVQARRDSLRKASSSLSRQIDRLTEAYLEQIVSLEEYRRRRRELEERKVAMQAQFSQLEARIDRQMELTAIAQGIESFCIRVQQGREQATFEQKRHLAELLIDRVVVTQEEVEIRSVLPTNPQREYARFYQLRIAYCGALSSHLSRGVPGTGSAWYVGARERGYARLRRALQ
jgi:site-specific DNA recombinase